MWTEPLPNGKYKAVERYLDPITGKQKKISVTIDRDTRQARKDAQRILDEKIDKVLEKTNYDNMTFGELCEKYLNDLPVKPSAKNSTRTVINRLCRTLGGSARINSLTASYVFNQLGHEESTKYNISIKRFKAVVRYGYAHDYIKDISWLAKLVLKKDDRKARIEDKYLEQDELALLLKNMMYRHQLLTKFLALSGLRIGEALALDVGDLDTYIHVKKTIDIVTGELMDTPKTVDSYRDVFIQPELAEVVKDVRKWRLEDMVKRGYRSDRFFPDICYETYYSYLTDSAKRTLGKKVTPHTLRHTHASLLAASGMSLEAISRRLGHADSKITKDVYLHVTEKLKEKEEAQISKVRLL